jgi:hypothetical protein
MDLRKEKEDEVGRHRRFANVIGRRKSHSRFVMLKLSSMLIDSQRPLTEFT